jgi:hypothetical protein
MARIICGNCHKVHASARAVRLCCELGSEGYFCHYPHEEVHTPDEAVACMDDLAAQQAAEIYAEAVMSWVCGGGSPEDARIYANVVASGRSWDEYLTGRDDSGYLSAQDEEYTDSLERDSIDRY